MVRFGGVFCLCLCVRVCVVCLNVFVEVACDVL